MLALFGGLVASAYYGEQWFRENPQHNPWAPLDLREPPGLATGMKLGRLQGDADLCRSVLDRSEIAFSVLDPIGEGECFRSDRLRLDERPFAPRFPEMTCSVAASFEFWMLHHVQPAADRALGTRVSRVEQLGTYNCRRIGGGSTGRFSEHATGNAIDISAFQFDDGRRISLLEDWGEETDEGRFLQTVRDGACDAFGTVLSPEYDAAHADHFHLDQARSPGMGLCR